MTNIKSLAGATALLLLIAVIDNFLIIEQAPGFEGMVLVKNGDVKVDSQQVDTAQGATPMPGGERFWIDRQAVDAEAFSRFVAATHYAAEKPAGMTEAMAELRQVELVSSTTQDDWQKNTDVAVWQGSQPTQGEPALAPASEPSGLHVTVEAARAYCAWLGKELPTEAQYELAAREVAPKIGSVADFDPHLLSGDAKYSFLPSFRCVRTQLATTD